MDDETIEGLRRLWLRESGWDHTARQRARAGAGGIPQAKTPPQHDCGGLTTLGVRVYGLVMFLLGALSGALVFWGFHA